MKKSLFILLFIPLISLAQINESDTLNLKAGLSLTGFIQTGNVQTLIYRGKADVSFRTFRKWVFKTQNSYVYQKFGGDKADEDFLSLNFLYLNPERKIYPLALGFVSTNFRRAIDVRYLVGAGASFQLYKKEKNWLKLSLTSEYERTNFSQTDFNIDAYDGSSSINTFRATLWVNGKYHLFKNRMIVSHESYIQPSLEESDNYRWQFDLGLEFPIWKFLNFKINYLNTFESIVIKSQKQQDGVLSLGFSLRNY